MLERLLKQIKDYLAFERDDFKAVADNFEPSRKTILSSLEEME